MWAMGDRTSVTTDAAGRRVMAKVAGSADEAALLENEAALLEAGRHPGVAELVGVDGHGVGSVLLTAHVEGATLAHVGRLPAEECAGLLAALATTLADLHDLGLVHGAVCPEHVVIGPDGRPVLCSLGYGGRVGERPRAVPALPAAFMDPAHIDSDALTPNLDVFGLGALARFLAPAPPPGHALGIVAVDATSEGPATRPSARAIAEALQREVPAARLPRGLAPRLPAGDGPAPPPADPLAAWRRERGRAGRGRLPESFPTAKVLVGAIAAIAVGAVVLVLIAAQRPSPPVTTPLSQAAPALPQGLPEAQPGPATTRAGLASSTTASSTTTTTSGAPSSTTVAPRRRDCPQVTAVLQADVDGDGCPDAMRYADGILESIGVRWSLGQVGDQVAAGDWGCQGGRTVALFRPGTGEIFRFAGWASPGRDLNVSAVARVDGGQILRAADLDGDGCHEAVVERGTGLPVEVVRLPRPQP